MSDYEILLLGDGSHLFRTMGWVLEYKGCRVRTAAGPEDAIEALVTKNFDLVIAKLSTGILDGLDVLKRAKKLNPEVKVMVLSGNHEMILPIEAYQIEVDDYVLMPISPAELWRRVSRCLESVVDLKPVQTLVAAPSLKPVAPVKRAKKREINDLTLKRLVLMFHDIRSCMVSCSAALKLVARGTYGDLDAQVSDKLHEIHGRMKKAVGLTEEFMKKTLGTDEAPEEQGILGLKEDVIEPVLEEFCEEIKERQIRVDNRLGPEFIAVKGSKLWLKSVVRNLLSNGIKHGGRGCEIVIDLEDLGSKCCLNVFNTGKPVPETYRPLLFSKIGPGGEARGDEGGMGLGLYLSREILNRQGGDIRYEAKNGGSNFVVVLPHV